MSRNVWQNYVFSWSKCFLSSSLPNSNLCLQYFHYWVKLLFLSINIYSKTRLHGAFIDIMSNLCQNCSSPIQLFVNSDICFFRFNFESIRLQRYFTKLERKCFVPLIFIVRHDVILLFLLWNSTSPSFLAFKERQLAQSQSTMIDICLSW